MVRGPPHTEAVLVTPNMTSSPKRRVASLHQAQARQGMMIM